MRLLILKLLFLSIFCLFAYTLINEFIKNRDINFIAIEIRSIDKSTNKTRVNKFDSVLIRTESLGYWVKTFKLTGRYRIDSTGIIKIRVNSKKINFINLYGEDVQGSDYFPSSTLSNKQVINIFMKDTPNYNE